MLLKVIATIAMENYYYGNLVKQEVKFGAKKLVLVWLIILVFLILKLTTMVIYMFLPTETFRHIMMQF